MRAGRRDPAAPPGRHLSGTLLRATSGLARDAGLDHLIAPVRPSHKDVFPAGLSTVHIDRDRDLGEYWEPNIWIIHPPAAPQPADRTA
jgi:hypothetical protein